MLEAVGVVAVAAVFGAAAGLHVGGFPRLGADGAQKGGRVAGARAHFHVIRLQEGAALGGPVLLKGEDDLLKADHGGKSAKRPFGKGWTKKAANRRRILGWPLRLAPDSGAN